MARKNNTAAATAPELILHRVFNAPCSLVYACWTENRHMQQWSAPHGFSMPHAEGKAEPGGHYRVCMKKPDGTVHAPDRPGLGFTLRADALDRFRYVDGPEFEF